MKENKNVIWGAIFLIGAVALLLNKLGILNVLMGGMSLFNIILTVFMVGILVKGLTVKSYGQILFSLAFIIIINDELLHMKALTPWPVLGAALLGTIGLNLMFRGSGKSGGTLRVNGRELDGPISEEKWEGDTISFENVFGESIKYISGEFSGARLENSFGSLQVYFTDALPKDGLARVRLENSFGNMVLYVPAEWRVELSLENNFGGIDEKGQCNPDSVTVLYVKGEVSFGKLEIRYI